jgi:hypothetical protein
MHRTLSKHHGKIAIGAALLATSVYVAMVSVTLAHLEFISGQVPFDMRPFGYGPSDAATLLDALGRMGVGTISAARFLWIRSIQPCSRSH